MGVGHPSEIVNLPEVDSKGGPPTSANNYGTPNTDLHINLSPNRHIKVYADTWTRVVIPVWDQRLPTLFDSAPWGGGIRIGVWSGAVINES